MKKKRSVGNTVPFLVYIEPDRLETLRRLSYDSCKISLNQTIRECIDLGLPFYCEQHGVYPSIPKSGPMTDESLENRKELLRKLVLAGKGELS